MMGTWIIRMDVNDRDGFAAYLAATPAALAKFGGRFLIDPPAVP